MTPNSSVDMALRLVTYRRVNAQHLPVSEGVLSTQSHTERFTTCICAPGATQEQPSPQPTTDLRKSLQTPRSLKKGFVHANDYQALVSDSSSSSSSSSRQPPFGNLRPPWSSLECTRRASLLRHSAVRVLLVGYLAHGRCSHAAPPKKALCPDRCTWGPLGFCGQTT